MARILVTGGAGLLGSHLCDRLTAGPNEVICLDNLSTGSKANIAHLEGKPHFFFQRHDVTQPLSIAGDVDEIYHLAALASPPDFERKPVETALPNSIGTYHLLELAKSKKARFVFASSSEVYGDPTEHPQRESYRGNVSLTGPRAPYDESKRFGEALALAYLRQHEVEVAIARIFNTYGPRMPQDGRVVSSFIVQALKGQPITVHGDGGQTRSFCYVTDLTDALVRLMAAGEPDPVNLGSPIETTVLDLAKSVKYLTKSSSEIVMAPGRTDDPARRKPDITRARSALKWEPTTSLSEGLRKTVDYFAAKMKGP
jgi:nucleoside-diphosphate-sugar epimerase